VTRKLAEGARKLGDLITEVMKSASPRPAETSALEKAWSRAAGAGVAGRTRLMGLRRGVLVVGFESPALRQEVEAFRAREILARLRKELPGRRMVSQR
jgi:hypothetical protein